MNRENNAIRRAPSSSPRHFPKSKIAKSSWAVLRPTTKRRRGCGAASRSAARRGGGTERGGGGVCEGKKRGVRRDAPNPGPTKIKRLEDFLPGAVPREKIRAAVREAIAGG